MTIVQHYGGLIDELSHRVWKPIVEYIPHEYDLKEYTFNPSIRLVKANIEKYDLLVLKVQSIPSIATYMLSRIYLPKINSNG
jgi:hypothetical protein